MKVDDTWKHSWTVDQETYEQFMELSQDRNPMHTNAEFAQQHGFEDKIVQGNILNAFLSYFIGEMLPKKNVIILGQSIKYAKPIFVGDCIDFSAKLSNHVEAVQVFEFDYRFSKAEEKIASGKIQIKEL